MRLILLINEAWYKFNYYKNDKEFVAGTCVIFIPGNFFINQPAMYSDPASSLAICPSTINADF